MADFSDLQSEVYYYWKQAGQALADIVAEVKKGTKANSKKLDKLFTSIRPFDISHFACSFCDRALQSYNAAHGTELAVTHRDVCYEAGCPAIPVCKEDNKKWEGFQCLSCVWYFKEGTLFRDEGNRYPLCEKWCKGFSQCEALVPTDTRLFAALTEEQKLVKLQFCLVWFWDEVIGKDGWGNTVFEYLLGE